MLGKAFRTSNIHSDLNTDLYLGHQNKSSPTQALESVTQEYIMQPRPIHLPYFPTICQLLCLIQQNMQAEENLRCTEITSVTSLKHSERPQYLI